MSSSGVNRDVTRNNMGISRSLNLPVVNTTIQPKPLNNNRLYYDAYTKAIVFSSGNAWKILRTTA